MDILTVTLTSAATAAFISGLMLLINGILERRERRRTLLFENAYRLANDRIARSIEFATITGKTIEVRDTIFLAAEYRPIVEEFFISGKLPKNSKEFYRGQNSEEKKPKL